MMAAKKTSPAKKATKTSAASTLLPSFWQYSIQFKNGQSVALRSKPNYGSIEALPAHWKSSPIDATTKEYYTSDGTQITGKIFLRLADVNSICVLGIP
jgi:hypothetical protein